MTTIKIKMASHDWTEDLIGCRVLANVEDTCHIDQIAAGHFAIRLVGDAPGREDRVCEALDAHPGVVSYEVVR